MSRIVRSSVLLIAVGCVALLLAACAPSPTPPAGPDSSQVPATAPTPAEQPAATGSGGWMDGIPATVPPFSYGTYGTQSNKIDAGNSTVYSLYYKDVTKENVTAYLEKLKAAGFTVVVDPNTAAGGVSATGELKKGDVKVVGLVISMQEGGTVDYTINVTK